MEVLSKEKIKPSSSPTPHHLQKFHLSLLDQKAPPTYVGLIFFYESPQNFDQSHISQNLKQSLSNVLTIFHPLSGRINQANSSVDHNDDDDGVPYIETRVHACMSDTTKNPDLTELLKFVPYNSYNPGKVPLCIQVNFFDCGGFAVGVCISHKIADTSSFVGFMNAWAATCRDEAETIIQQPSFDLLSHYFLPVDMSSMSCSEQSIPESEMDQKIIAKIFVFDKEMLSALKRVGASSNVSNPTKTEALTAFLWRNFMVSNKGDSLERRKTRFAAMHAVNVRSRANPPLSAQSFGNGCLQAIAWSESIKEEEDKEEEEEGGYAALISKVRNAIKEIDGDYVCKMMRNVGEHSDQLSSQEGEGRSLEVCIFSSWCRFPTYEVDFGWGKPQWVSTYPVPLKNLTVFMDTKCGNGIEAWVNMAEANMAMIEKNYRYLLSNASLDLII